MFNVLLKNKFKCPWRTVKLKPELLSVINRRKFRYFGYANRNTITHLMTTVALQGKVGSYKEQRKTTNLVHITGNSGWSLREVVHIVNSGVKLCLYLRQRPSISMMPHNFLSIEYTFLSTEIHHLTTKGTILALS